MTVTAGKSRNARIAVSAWHLLAWQLHETLYSKTKQRTSLLKTLRHIWIVGKSALFDREWYVCRYPDVAVSGLDPLVHYLVRGGTTGYDPHPLFDSSWYLENYHDVSAANLNPLVHYLLHGGAEGRDPHPLFDTRFFLNQTNSARRPK